MLNQRFWNISTFCLAKEWDQLYSDVRLYFGIHVLCSDALDMFQGVQGSPSFELLLIKEAERRERLRKRMRALCLSGLHPFLNGAWELAFIVKHNITADKLQLLKRSWSAKGGTACKDAGKGIHAEKFDEIHREWSKAGGIAAWNAGKGLYAEKFDEKHLEWAKAGGTAHGNNRWNERSMNWWRSRKRCVNYFFGSYFT